MLKTDILNSCSSYGHLFRGNSTINLAELACTVYRPVTNSKHITTVNRTVTE